MLAASVRVHRADISLPCFMIALQQQGKIESIIERFKVTKEASDTSTSEGSSMAMSRNFSYSLLEVSLNQSVQDS